MSQSVSALEPVTISELVLVVSESTSMVYQYLELTLIPVQTLIHTNITSNTDPDTDHDRFNSDVNNTK